MEYCQGPQNGRPCPEHPLNTCQRTSEESNAPDGPLVKPQTPRVIADHLMDWLDQNGFSYVRGAEALGISLSALLRVSNSPANVHSSIIIKLAYYISTIQHPGESR